MTSEFGALDSELGVDSLDFQEDVQPETPATPTPEEPSQPERITFEVDPNDIYGSIRSLSEKHPKVANVINSMVGMKARTQYEPKLQEAQLQLARYQRGEDQRVVAAVPEAQRGHKVLTDPKFKAAYERVEAPDTFDAQARSLEVQRTVLSLIGSAIDSGLSPDRAEDYLNKLRSGEYDKDAEGNILSFDDSIARLNRDVMSALRTGVSPQAPVTTPQEGQPESSPPAQVAPSKPLIDSASPDLSNSSSGARGQRYTAAEIKNMDPDTFIRH